jgi:predicted unusual protein kinase regulating ubiquinone biosynthesis (AarF/ABC1/UbiB family)
MYQSSRYPSSRPSDSAPRTAEGNPVSLEPSPSRSSSTSGLVPRSQMPEFYEPQIIDLHAIHKSVHHVVHIYDPAVIDDRYRDRFGLVWKRILNIFLPLFLFFWGTWWDKKTGNTSPKQEEKRAIQLRETITKLGPAFIKVGQALSTRPDLLSAIYLQEMSKLQDQLPPFANSIAHHLIERELGASPEDLYAEFSEQPMAAASLGQVYKARLKTGEWVAVKVQRPGLEEQITLDLYILRKLAQWVMSNTKRVRSDLVAIMDEFGSRIFDEMDYTQEGKNAERFAELYGNFKDIYVPQIYWDYTSRHVLTMSWVAGTKLTKLEEIQAQGIDVRYLIEVGVQCSLRQLLEHGFFHADPHPGNLLATPEGKLAYLDFGMMSEVKTYQRYGLIEAIVHLVNRDFDGLAQDYIKLEFLTPDTDLTELTPALAEVFNNALGASVAELNFKSITDQLSNIMYEYPFRVPAYYALIIRSLVTLEGIAINVDPNFKVLSKAYPYVAKRLLTDQSVELRTSLRQLLFKDGSFRWNRLENLLRNAKQSDDYDLDRVLDQVLDFLFSERGEFIRDRLVDELVNGIDLMGRNTLQSIRHALEERIGLPLTAPVIVTPEEQDSLDRLQRISEILRNTQGFDPWRILQTLPKLVSRPELQSMGQQVASDLAQKAIARLIRSLLVQELETA